MLLSIGMVIVIDTNFKRNGEKFKSKVVDMGDNFIMIDYPTNIETGKTAFFIDGTQLLVNFTSSTQTSFAFQTEVSGRLMKGIPMLKLTYPGDDQLIKIQRREFVRVETSVDVAVEKDGVNRQLVAEDISAGGLAVNLPGNLLYDQDEIVSLTIVLPFMNKEIKYIFVEAKVIRVWEKDGRKIVSLQFMETDQLDRQQIIRFCFERQLQLRNEK